jgi:two-component system chemotaxis response regulator CheY
VAQHRADDGDDESEYSQIVRALAAGAHEYVIKPFTEDAIAEKLALLGIAAGSLA